MRILPVAVALFTLSLLTACAPSQLSPYVNAMCDAPAEVRAQRKAVVDYAILPHTLELNCYEHADEDVSD